MDLITEIKSIMAALQTIDMKSTKENMNAVLGSLQHLEMMLEYLQNESKEQEKPGNILKMGDK